MVESMDNIRPVPVPPANGLKDAGRERGKKRRPFKRAPGGTEADAIQDGPEEAGREEKDDRPDGKEGGTRGRVIDIRV